MGEGEKKIGKYCHCYISVTALISEFNQNANTFQTFPALNLEKANSKLPSGVIVSFSRNP